MQASTSVAFEDLRGKSGSVVVTKGRSGLVIRPRVSGKNPRTPSQETIRFNLARAASAYKNLTSAQAAAWQAFALTVTKVNPVTGKTYHPTAISLFVGLAAKFLQANPGGTIPVAPPASSFIGDTITLTATPGLGQIIFAASAANAAGVTTELLLQRLPARNRTPESRGYRTKAFSNFGTSLSKVVNVTAGYYAAAYRFVNTNTGQTTPLQTLPVAQVSLSVSKADSSASKKAA